MKINQIYSNKKEFKWVKFNEQLNVILGVKKDREKTDSDSHNLGKSTLISVIDFMFLQKVSGNNHLFKKNYNLFKDYTFFMELKKDEKNYVTIKRDIRNNTKISLKFHSEPFQDYRENQIWDLTDLPLTTTKPEKNPKIILNNYFGFINSEKYNYRKYLGYFLRTQYDYDEVFKLKKFAGSQMDWKPALLELLGFKGDFLSRKLSLENQISLTKKYLEQMKEELKVTDYEVDVIQSLIDDKVEDKKKLKEKIDRFDFYNKERENNKLLVEKIESKISQLNTMEYNLSYEIEKIKNSLHRNFEFDFKKIETIFNQAKVLFGNQIKKGYNELVQFNNDIIKERSTYQEKVLQKKNNQLEKIRDSLKELNEERKTTLSGLQNTDTMKKFKNFQSELINVENEISNLLNKLDNVDIIKSINKKLENLDKEFDKSISDLKEHLEEPNSGYVELKNNFRSLAKEILGESAILYYKVNQNNNPDFYTEFVNINESSINAQSDGYSYKKMLCVCFDLALLITYSSRNFFKFVYHDGVYESMSDTRKIKFLDKIRSVCDEYDIQYILTTLSDDIPMDSNNNPYNFKEEEIILTLHDDDDNSGRLFSRKF
ncbi:DUF2326 domain-containing protein [Mesobacillus maritimus]|uniref:DUF2326 domain-containing protein n=1 Tax=Mesobacillus maritimus TaxID=1643336 RepID=UPI00203FBFD0|nr:DUF2326 domain-containing protein [Mesobacillus maritimus]MCM3587357.1 DUF2326 domain-containing protein [Mesobacillus maritimus]